MSKTRLILTGEAARQAAGREVMAAPEGYVVEIKERTRSGDANARFHAMLTDVARQLQYLGQKRSVEFWKGLFVSGWQLATGQKPEICPGLEGEFINIRESTATMSGKRLASVMEYVQAYGDQQGVRWSAPDDERNS